MSELLDLLPECTAKKLGKALFVEHKGKIDGVMAAATATDSELRDPKKLAEWFELPDGSSAGKKTVVATLAKKKFKFTVEAIDYDKIVAKLDKGNVWFKKMALYNPEPTIKKRSDAVFKEYLAYHKVYYYKGADDPTAIKLAEKAFDPMLALAIELQDVENYYAGAAKVFPKHQKVFEEYAKMFDDAKNVFGKLHEVASVLNPEYMNVIFAHYRGCELVAGACNTASNHCKKLAKVAPKYHKKARSSRQMMSTWMNHVGETLVPAKAKQGAAALKAATKPMVSNFRKLFGM